jgi:hypothetical protein
MKEHARIMVSIYVWPLSHHSFLINKKKQIVVAQKTMMTARCSYLKYCERHNTVWLIENSKIMEDQYENGQGIFYVSILGWKS